MTVADNVTSDKATIVITNIERTEFIPIGIALHRRHVFENTTCVFICECSDEECDVAIGAGAATAIARVLVRAAGFFARFVVVRLAVTRLVDALLAAGLRAAGFFAAGFFAAGFFVVRFVAIKTLLRLNVERYE